MRRYLAVATLVAAPFAALVVTAGPAAACQPENAEACRRCAEVNATWSKLTGKGDLMHCPY